jgi:DNA polymerase
VAREKTIGGRRVYLYPLFHPAAALRASGTAELLRQDIAALPALIARGAPSE